jgi:hypothetical protein
MFTKLINKIKYKYFKKPMIGVSCDSNVKLKDLPLEDITRKSIFYSLNKDFGVFEITKYSKNPDLVYLVEVGTDNEIVIERKLFDILFVNLPIPKEIAF